MPKIAHGHGAGHACATLQGMELAFEFRHRGFVRTVAAPLGERLLDGGHNIGGLLEEDLEQFRIEIFLDGLVGALSRDRPRCGRRDRRRWRRFCDRHGDALRNSGFWRCGHCRTGNETRLELMRLLRHAGKFAQQIGCLGLAATERIDQELDGGDQSLEQGRRRVIQRMLVRLTGMQ